ncbi:MAG: hypothetical protein LBH72_04960 [Proteiniphilum sp.]|jgi:hypothetical protein|nr:hypothetical protein [Proteiniphilum sp.]
MLLNLTMPALIGLLLFRPERKKMAPVAVLLIVLIAAGIVITHVCTVIVLDDAWDVWPFAVIENIAFILLAAHCLPGCMGRRSVSRKKGKGETGLSVDLGSGVRPRQFCFFLLRGMGENVLSLLFERFVPDNSDRP